MTEQEFLSELETILNVEESLTLDTKLAELEEWDSLAALMFQLTVLKRTKIALKPDALKGAETVADLYEFIKQ